MFYRTRPSPEEEEPNNVNNDPEGKVGAKTEPTLPPGGEREKSSFLHQKARLVEHRAN